MAVQLWRNAVLAYIERRPMPGLRNHHDELGWMMKDQEQDKAAHLERWNRLRDEAIKKMRLHRARMISRGELEQWLKAQSAMDERTLRGMLNRMTGK